VADREPAAEVIRGQVIAFRWAAHQLDRTRGTVADTALLDYGVQDTGPRGARWALANRGLVGYDNAEVLLAWTIRVSPHLYRRADARAIAIATSPYDDTDAAKRIFDASKPLRKAGVPVLQALAAVAGHERDIVSRPTVKGDLSTALTPLLDEHSVRWCKPCQATHAWEGPFRIAALQAGLELDPETSPPVLRRTKGGRPLMFRRSGTEAEPRFDVLRNYLRFYGPARAADAAKFLDAPLSVVRDHWPEDAVAVEVSDLPGGREQRWALSGDLVALRDAAPASPASAGGVRLLGPYDAWVQLRDRETLVSDAARAKDLWRTIGRPGAVAVGGELVGTWRPSSKGSKLTVTVERWGRLGRGVPDRIGDQAELLASVRGQELAGLELTG
jgi:hypothetical protein